MRLKIFQEGLGAQIVLSGDEQEIGIDEDWVLKKLRSPVNMRFSDTQLMLIVSFAIALLGPFYSTTVWKEYQSLKNLELSYVQAQSLVEILRERHENASS